MKALCPSIREGQGQEAGEVELGEWGGTRGGGPSEGKPENGITFEV